MKLRKTHKFEEIPHLDIRCPYCGKWDDYIGDYIEGFVLFCKKCKRKFEKGKYEDY